MDEDKAAEKINVNLPGAKQNLNLGLVKLQPKYSTQIKMKPNKIKGLQKVRETMAERGRWIDDVFKEQEYAREYKYDEEDLPLLDEIPVPDNILEDYEPVQRIPSEGWYIDSIVFFLFLYYYLGKLDL